MTRLAETFKALRARRERALIPYFTAGDPSLGDTPWGVGNDNIALRVSGRLGTSSSNTCTVFVTAP